MPVSFADLEKKSLRASEQDRPDVARHRSRWRVWQRYMDADRFVFLDETSASTNMVRRSGWGPKGERLVGEAPRALENHDLCGGPAGKRDHRTLRAGWAR